jgi:putative ABC transport system substrate-binding protein
VKRRDFMALFGGAAAGWPLAARAQMRQRIPRIGVLVGLANDAESQQYVATFRQVLGELGLVEGSNLQVDYRWAAGNPDLMQRHAADLVGMQPDVIVTHSTPALIAVQKETRTIPVVFVMVSDPVGMRYIESMKRPGGNVTGFTPFEPSLGGKWVELLKEIAPRTTRAELLFNPETAANAAPFVQSAELAGSSLGLSAATAVVRSNSEIERSLEEAARRPGGAVIILPDAFTSARRGLIIAATVRRRLPLIAPFRSYTTDGGLASYGIDTAGEYRRAAGYVDRILKGERPADLPVQAPTRYELIVNLKTAKTLDLTVPQSLLARADEVIE